MTDLAPEHVWSAASGYAHLCASCPTASAGGECPYCGTVWGRDEGGKIISLPSKQAPVDDFWRNSATLKERVDYAKEIDPRMAEAVDALARLWNIVALKLLSDQQGAVLLLCHTHPAMSSRDVADALKVSQPAAANVLGNLVSKGLLTRDRVGNRVTYSVAVLWPMGRVSTAAGIVNRGLLERLAS